MEDSSRIGTVNTNITMSSTSQATAAFGTETYQIRVATSGQPGYFTVDQNPVATTSSPLMPSNWVDYITVSPGMKAAVLQAGTGGIISITEMT